jgi:hypothetical protein
MSTLQLENIKHPDASGNALELGADGSVTNNVYFNGDIGIGTSTPTVDGTGTAPGWMLPVTQIKGPRPTLYLNGSGSLATIRMWPNGTDGSSTTLDDFHINAIATSGSTPGSLVFAAQGGAIGAGLSINSNNIVTTPDNPAFQAQAVANDTTYGQQVIPYPGVITNRGGHYNNSTYRFTAPVSGAYCFSWDGWHNAITPGTGRMFIRKNGSYVTASGYNSGHGIHARLGDTAEDDDSQMTAVLELSAGDYVDIYNGADNVRLFYSSGFSGFLIG